jgi:glycosyltransferase involved in cell wall biosynthesis
MRVVLLTHYYPPELGAAPARIAALARGLADRGVQVTVHTGFPHYPSGVIARPHRNRPLQREHDNGVTVLRSAVYPTANRGFARRLANHAAFAAGALLTCAATGPADVVIAETPPLFTAAAGVAYARVKRARLALNVSDLWPESAIELQAIADGSAAARAAHALARRCYRDAALITAPTEGIVASLRERPGVSAKVVWVPPAVDLERFATIPVLATAAPAIAAPAIAAPTPALSPPAEREPLRVLYAGTLGLAQGLDTLVQAAALAGPAEVQLLLAGEGPEEMRLREQVSAGAHSNVQLLGPVAPEQVPELYAQAHAGVVVLRDRRIFAGALPTKLFEVFAAGRPAIVAVPTAGEAAAMVRDAGAGLVVAPEDPHALAEAFRRLRAQPLQAAAMGARGQELARRFDRAGVVEQWWQLLHALEQSR